MKNYLLSNIIFWIITGSLCNDSSPIYTYDINSVPSQKCDDGSYQCNDGSCIPEKYYCNGMIDCETGEDERDCRTCPVNFCSCTDGLCINVDGRCNAKIDCGMEGEDEENCNDGNLLHKKMWNFYKPTKQCTFEGTMVPNMKLNCSYMELTSVPCVTYSINILILNNNKLGLFNGLSDLSFKGDPYHKLIILDMERNHIKHLPTKIFENKHFLQELSLAGNRILHLDGMIFPPNLKKLYLQNNKITNLPPKVFENLTKLMELSLAYNQIEHLDDEIFSDLHDLEILNLTRNSVRTLGPGAFSGLVEIRILDLSHNQLDIITDKTFQHKLEKLRTLYLNSNNIARLDGNLFPLLKNLNQLFFQHNKISIINDNTFNQSNSLRILDLSYNKLTELRLETIQPHIYMKKLILNDNHIVKITGHIVLGRMQFLDDLFIHRNKITKLFPFPRCRRINYCELDSVDISENEIEEIEIAHIIPFEKYYINELSLQHNRLKTLRFGMFNSTRVRRLKINNNQITTIEDYAFNGLSTMFPGAIFLNSNNLMNITSHMFEGIEGGCTSLYLDNNKITTVEENAFRPFEYLTMLDLSSNAFHKLTVKMFRGVTTLHNLALQNNRIERIEKYSFNEMKRLEMLNLSNNRLNELRPDMFESSPHLQQLYLQMNKIESIAMATFHNLSELLTLDLSDNMIAELQSNMFEDLLNLKTLSLRRNKVRSIKHNAFKNLRMMTALDLSYNEIISLPPNVLSDAKNLRDLHINYNKIKIIDKLAFSGLIALSNLNLNDNEIGDVDRNIFKRLRRLQKLTVDEFRFCCLKTNIKKCESPRDEFSSCEDLMKNSILRTFVWLLGVISIIANSFVVIFRIKYRSSNTNKVNSFLIKNLAMSDLFMGIYLLIIAMADTIYRGEYYIYDKYWRESCWCNLAGFLSTFSSELTVFILTILSIDRLYTISFPIRARQRGISRTKKLIAIVWVLAAIISLVPLPLFNIRYFKNFYGRSGVCLSLHVTNDTPTGWQYSVFVFIILNAILFAVIAVCYFSMFIITTKARKSITSSNHANSTAIAFRMTLLVMADAACWIPIITLGIRSLMGINPSPHVYPWVAVFVLPLNAALNPILYTLSSIPMVIKVKFPNTRLNGRLVFVWPCRWVAANNVRKP